MARSADGAAILGYRPAPMGFLAGVLANLLVVGTLAYAALLNAYDSDLYYRSIQEDEYLEWGTFWAFVIAAGVCVVGAIRQRRATRRLPWFLFGVALFCFMVAMEEISWGQRILGYRPPTYFLEYNYQQELTVHNVFSTELRKLTLTLVITGYGIVLPLVALVPAPGRLLRRAAVVVSPPALIPGFLAALIAYVWYPWSHSGEWVEFMVGLGFLFGAVVRALSYPSPASSHPRAPRQVALVAASWLVAIGLGAANAAASRSHRGIHPENVEAARAEIEALTHDFGAAGISTRCGLHKRLYTYLEKYQQEHSLDGEFSRLTAQGLPAERAEFFLDPWNSPYWIRHKCTKDRSRRRVVVYSLGPNRRRDSTRWEVRGDDVAAVILEDEPPGSDRKPPLKNNGTDADP